MIGDADKRASADGTERRGRRFRLRLWKSQNLDRARQPLEPPPSAIIGRKAELETFRRLSGMEGGAPSRGAVLAVIGAAGSGKRSLLEAFARSARSRPAPRCSSVTDFSEPLDLVELLEQIARSFDVDRAAFESFESTLEKYRYRRERGRSRAMEYAETGRQLTSVAQETAPTMATGVAKAVGAAAPPIVEALEHPRDLESVKRAFLADLASLSHSSREHPVVLLFYAFDRHPEATATIWVRKRLVPDATKAGALVVLSVDTREAIEGLRHDVPVDTILLDTLRDEDVMLFISDRLGIPPHTRLAREVVEASEGSPEKLARFESYFKQYGDARKLDALPEDARVWAEGRSELEPFDRLEPPEARRLVLCASALRRLNEPLLRAVGKASGLPDASCDEAVDTLLDSRTRPSWIAAGVAGWTIVPQIRQPLLHEFRRRDPMLLRAVHEAAGRYHLDRLRELEGDPQPATLVTSFVPRRPPSKRFADPAFIAALCDWLYHLMALDAEEAFGHMFAQAVDALLVDEADEAVRLLESGPSTSELAELDAYRRGLAEVATALRDKRHSEALAAIERLEALEVTDDLLRVAADFLAGSSGVEAGWSAEQAVARFERVETQLQNATDERRLRLRATNLQWLALNSVGLADEDGDSGPAVAQAAERLETVRKIAEQLNDVEMQAETLRVHALVLQYTGDIDAALKRLEEARAALSTLKAPRSVAGILTTKADLLREMGSLVEARRELERAAQIGRSLDDPTLEADARLAMVELELKAGKLEEASRLADDVVGLRPYDPQLRYRLGLVFHQAAGADFDDPEARNAVVEAAVRAYSAALEIAEEPLFYRNRGYARLAQAPVVDHEALHEAADDLQEAVERGYREPDVYLNLAEIRRDLGQDEAASTAAYAELELIAQNPAAFGKGDVDGRIDRALALVRRDTTEVLEDCTRAYPDHARLQFLLGLARREGIPPDLDGAAKAFRSASTLVEEGDPARAGYLVALADVECEAQNLSAADEAIQQALNLDPRDVQAEAVQAKIAAGKRSSLAASDDTDAGVLLSPIRLDLGEELVQRFNPDISGNRRFFDLIDEIIRVRIRERTGVTVPGVRCRRGHGEDPWEARLFLHGSPRDTILLPGAYFTDATPEECAAAAGVSATVGRSPWDGAPVSVVDEAAALRLTTAGIAVWDAAGGVAATLGPMIEARAHSFIDLASAELMAVLAGWEVKPDDLEALTGFLRDLAHAGIQPDEATDAIRLGGLEAGQEWLQAHADAGGGASQAGLAAWEVKEFALRAEVTEPAADAGVVVTLELGSELDQAAAKSGVREAASALCDALSLPHPRLEIVKDADLPPDGFRLTIDGSTRVAATVAGMRELPPRYRAAASSSVASDPAAVIARSIETALLDDPSFLLPEAVAETLASNALEHMSVEETSAWTTALRRAAAARAPVGQEAVRGAILMSARSEAWGGTGTGVLDSRPSRPIPDGVRHGVRDVLPFRESGQVAGLRVCATIRHEYVQDLRVTLIAPDGHTATLHDQQWQDRRDLRLVRETPSATELAPLLGAETEGEWTLLVQDLAEGDAGTLVFWSLEIELEGAPARSRERDQDRPDAVQDVLRAERLTFALRPYGLEVRLGSALADALEIRDKGAEPDEELLGPLRRLSRDVGLPLLRAVSWRQSKSLGSDEYELVVNGLPRIRGVAPPDLVFVQTSSAASRNVPTGFDPKTGAPGVWLPSAESVEAASDGEEPLTAGTFVILEAEACIRRNAPDFIDLGATQQHLDGLAALSPLLVSTLRSRYPDEVISATFARLSGLGVSLRDPRVFDRLLERPPSVRESTELDAAAALDSARLLAPELLAEHVVRALTESIEYGHFGDGIETVAIGLDAETEDEIREAVRNGGWPEPAYHFGGAASFLMALEERLRSVHPAAVVLVTSGDLRRHVRTLVAAQYPGLPVLSQEGLRRHPSRSAEIASTAK